MMNKCICKKDRTKSLAWNSRYEIPAALQCFRNQPTNNWIHFIHSDGVCVSHNRTQISIVCSPSPFAVIVERRRSPTYLFIHIILIEQISRFCIGSLQHHQCTVHTAEAALWFSFIRFSENIINYTIHVLKMSKKANRQTNQPTNERTNTSLTVVVVLLVNNKFSYF